MPKQPAARTNPRSAPYNRPMATTIAPQVATYLPLSHAQTDWHSAHLHPVQHNMVPLTDIMNPYPHTQHQQIHPAHAAQSNQSNPWSSDEDDILVHARTRGLGWNQIHERHFQSKSANACRKRYERLMIKRRGTDWDEARLERMAVGYRDMREQMWKPLAHRVGERWEHVEKACMQQGLKSLQNLASNHSRNYSSSSSKLGHLSSSEGEAFSSTDEHDQNDDSGIALGGDGVHRPPNGAMPSWNEILDRPQQGSGRLRVTGPYSGQA